MDDTARLWPLVVRELLALFPGLSPQERYQVLIEYADAFEPVPPEVATRPYPAERLVPHCESQVYAWVDEAPGQHRVQCHFAVENPQGLAARAMARVLQLACAHAPAWQVASIPDDLPQRLFGARLSMGRTLGLNALVARVTAAAQRHVAQCAACQQAQQRGVANASAS